MRTKKRKEPAGEEVMTRKGPPAAKSEVKRAAAIFALAKFLSVSQAHLSIVIAMPGSENLARAWQDARDALGLSGWHSEGEALEALRKAFDLPSARRGKAR